MNNILNLLKNKYLLINKIMIYILLLSMSLFLSTDYFPIVEVILGFIGIYLLLFLYIKKYIPIIKLIHTAFTFWYFIFWFFVIIVTIFRNPQQLVVLLKTLVVFSVYIFEFGILYSDSETREFIDISEIITNITIFLCLWILVLEFPLLIDGERIGFSVMVGNPNSAGSLLSVYSFFIIYRFEKNRSKKDLFALILCLLLVLFTGSKKSIIVIAIAVLLFLFKDGSIVKRRIVYFTVIMSIVLLLCFTIPVLYENIGRRFLALLGELGIINFQPDHSSELRVTYMNKAIDLWSQNKFLGGGYDNFRINSGFATYSHNNYTELLSATGIIGTLLYYSYYLFLLKKNILKKSMISIISVLFIVSVFFTDIGSVIYTVYPFYYMVLLIIDIHTEYKLPLSARGKNYGK